MSFSLDNSILHHLGINTRLHSGIKFNFTSVDEKAYKETVTEMVSYRFQQKIKVPPYTSIAVDSTVDKFNFDLPFKAKIRVSGKADILDVNGKVVLMTDRMSVSTHFYVIFKKKIMMLKA